jgi:hypothetical protein
MKLLKKYSGLIIVIIFCYVGMTDNYTIRIGFLVIVLISAVLFDIKTIIQSKKWQIVDAEIISFELDFENEDDENNNFRLLVNLHLPNQEFKEINVKGLYFKPPKKGDKIKVLINENDINQSKIFKGTEITNAYLQIVIMCILLFFIYFYTYILPINKS